MRTCVLILAMVLATVAAVPGTLALAGGGRCSHCGCNAPCQKVCRLVQDEKKIEIVCWGCKCEDFCLPYRSTPLCEHCDTACVDEAAPGKGPECVKPKTFVWTQWLPGCGARIHTKKKLMKKVVTKKSPSFKWVVEDLCPRCESQATAAAYEPDAAIPLPPEGNARILVGNLPATPAAP